MENLEPFEDCCCDTALPGEEDLLGALEICDCGCIGDETCEPCCECCFCLAGVGALGTAGVAAAGCGDEMPDGVCLGWTPGTATMPACEGRFAICGG
jgi:hypothetical protein